MVDMSVNFAGLKFKNPIVAAAGYITHTPTNLRKCIEAGVGGITTKSITLDSYLWERPRAANFFLDRHENPGTLMHFDFGLLSPQLAISYIKDIKPLAEKENVVVIGNIILGEWSRQSSSQDEYPTLKDLAIQIQEAGADMLEIGTYCPILVSAEERVLQDKEQIPMIINTLKNKLQIPFLIKMGYGHDLFFLENIKKIEKLGIKAIHPYSNIPGTLVDIETGRPLVAFPYIYGRHRRGVDCYLTTLAFTNTNLQIMNSGGLWSWRDVVERLMCGATIAAVHTAVEYRGYKVFQEMISGLKNFLEKKGYGSVEEIIGRAASQVCDPVSFMATVKKNQIPIESVKINIDPIKCNGCEKCVACNQGAIRVEGGVAKVELDACIRCGVCSSLCIREAISLSFANQ